MHRFSLFEVKVHMRKVLVILFLTACTHVLHAVEYPYLVFTNTAGTTTVMRVNSLTITVSGTQLQVTNADTSASFLLTELSNMQFSTNGDTATALSNVLNADKPVELYTLTGIRLGRFDSLIQAAHTLSTGTYLVTDGTNTQKIVVR